MKALTKDLIDNPGLWRLSMLIGDYGIDVFAHPMMGEGSVVAAHVGFDASVSSKASALEDAIYANPLLLLTFRKTDIVMGCDMCTPVPIDVDPDNLRRMPGMETSYTMMESPLNSREKLIYAVDKGITNFIQRTYDTAQPVHVLSVLNFYYTRKNGLRNSTSRMYINLGADSLDILVYNKLGLAAARHFEKAGIDECAYWALAIYKQSALDPDCDEIIISGDPERRHSLLPRLSKFVSCVMPAIFPSAIYHGDSAAMKAAFPLVILPLCE